MKSSKKFIIALVVLVLLAAAPAVAKSTYYFKGDQVFSIRAGVDFPGFISFYNDPDRGTVTFWDTHLRLGGVASIAYQGYINERLALGGELGYVFNYSRSNKIMTTVPLTAKLTFVPVQTGRFDLAASLNLGGAFIRYDEGRFFSPYASVTITPTIFFNENWGLGLETGIMATMEFYTRNSNKHDASAFCGLLPVTLALSYRH
ncbi:MAG: hypothetical protein IJ863_00105 [Spirochaetales bacterium]|nr:hypothetical protein [Spirochaetales bacterium]